jgi:uncharacterized protein (DUF1810 family)
MPLDTLERFRIAQERPGSGFAQALAELETTGKRGHWIWYVLPQLAGLGASPTAREFEIRDAEEAAAYLRDSMLRSRLVAIARVIVDRLEGGQSLELLMGSRTDALKTVSSLTLFGHVASGMRGGPEADECAALADAAARTLAIAAVQGYPPCRFTLRQIGDPGT